MPHLFKFRAPPFVRLPLIFIPYTYTAKPDREAISSYSLSNHVNQDEVNVQLSFAFLIWHGILGDNPVMVTAHQQD